MTIGDLTIGDFLYYAMDDCYENVEVFNCDNGKTLWSGKAKDCPEEYLDTEIGSFNSFFVEKSYGDDGDTITESGICFNI